MVPHTMATLFNSTSFKGTYSTINSYLRSGNTQTEVRLRIPLSLVDYRREDKRGKEKKKNFVMNTSREKAGKCKKWWMDGN